MEGFKTIFEPFKIKMVEPIDVTTEEQREHYLKEAHYNPFLLHSDKVMIDFLTDSGTSAMSSNQWAGMMNGDESYAGARSWIKMRDVIRHLTGHEHVLLINVFPFPLSVFCTATLAEKEKHLSAILTLIQRVRTLSFQAQKQLIL